MAQAGHAIGMAVNVSASQLDSDQLVADIEAALSDSGLEPGALTIEITETTLMRNVEETARRLAEVKRLGVRIAIDDFGTGYSSLAHLQRFPVDALKIDRSFIAGLSQNKEGETLIHTLVQLGKALSIETFAEGIEQQQQLSRAARRGTATAGRASCSPAPSTPPRPRRSWKGPLPRPLRADRPRRRRRPLATPGPASGTAPLARPARGRAGSPARCATMRALRRWAQGTRPRRRGSSTTHASLMACRVRHPARPAHKTRLTAHRRRSR